MNLHTAVSINLAVEGPVDEAVIGRVFNYVGVAVGNVYGHKGRKYLKQKIAAFNHAARLHPWLVVVDLDVDQCPPALCAEWLPAPSEGMALRVAVHQIESWLLADREMISDFLGVPLSRIPFQPERIPDSKQIMVQLARASRRREIRDDMVPREGSPKKEGRAYAARLIEYANSRWRVEVAKDNAESLHRCINAVERLLRTWR